MRVKSTDETLREVLKTYFFLIPRFQRPYSWSIEQIDELWDDITQEKKGEYFIGSMVVYKLRKDTVAVVDGQQRLTTLMMLLVAIRDSADQLKNAALGDGTHTFVEHPDEDSKVRFVLKTETSYPFLEDEILARGPATLNAKVGTEEEALKAGFDKIKEHVASAIAEATAATPAEKKAEASAQALTDLRDKILGLALIFIEALDEDDATTIFVTINSRGKDLEQADLVKAHILQLLPKTGDLDRPRIRWEQIGDLLSPTLSTTDLLLVHWRSRYGQTTAKKLAKDVRRTIKAELAERFLVDLEKDAKLFVQINRPAERKWNIEGKEAQASLQFLVDFSISQSMPLLLALMRDFDGKRLTMPQLRRGLKAVEDYHFMWNVLTKRSSSGGMSHFFGSRARALSAAADKAARGRELDSIVADLAAKRPSAAEAEAAFSDLWFTEDLSGQKKIVQYVLTRFYKNAKPTAAVDFSQMTIEHLKPQKALGRMVGRLGNLIYISEKLNTDLDSKQWAQKQLVLSATTSEWIPDDVKKAVTWDDPEIGARTLAMARTAHATIWKG